MVPTETFRRRLPAAAVEPISVNAFGPDVPSPQEEPGSRSEIPNLAGPLKRFHTGRFQVVPAKPEEGVSAGGGRKEFSRPWKKSSGLFSPDESLRCS